MVKFLSSEDEDYKTISGHLGSMVSIAPQKIAEKWRLDKRYEEIDLGIQTKISYHATPSPSQIFTGRRDYLEKLRHHFGASVDQSQSQQRKYFLLYGMGGVG